MERKGDTSATINDELFLKVFELSTGSLIVKTDTPHYTVIAAGNDFLESFLVKRDEVIGKSFLKVIPGRKGLATASILINAFNEAILTKKKIEVPFYSCELITPGKKDIFYWSAVNVPILGEDGEVSHIIYTPLNITDQVILKQKEDAKLLNLQIKQVRMNELFMKAPVGVTFLNKDNFMIEYANHAICEMWNRGGPEAVVGKPAFEVAVEVADFRKTMERVIRTGVPFVANDAPVLLNRNNKPEIYYFDLIFDPLRDSENQITGIIGIAVEVTDKVKSKQLLLASEQRFRSLITDAPVAISVLKGYDMLIESANHIMLGLWGKQDNIIGEYLINALPELEGQSFIQLLQNVYINGLPYYGYEAKAILNRKGRDETCYFNFVYQPLKEEDENVTGVMVVATEVTEQIIAKHDLEEKEKQLRNLVIKSPVAMGLLSGENMVIDLYNAQLLKIWNKTSDEVNGKRLLDVFPELIGQPFPEILVNVYKSGIAYSANEVVAYVAVIDRMLKYYLDITYEPMVMLDNSVSGIMITVIDVTEKVIARHKLEDAEERLRLATESTGLGTWDLDLKTSNIIHTPRLAEIFGQSSDVIITQRAFRNFLYPDDRYIVINSYKRALQTGKYFYEVRIIWPDNSIHWIRTTGRVIYDDEHQPLRMLGTVNDVTGQRNLIDELKASEENLRLATQAAELGTFDMDLLSHTMEWDTRCRELFGIYTYKPVSYEKDFLPALHPDDREHIARVIEQLMDKKVSNGDFNVEYRTVGVEDNKVRWIKARGKVSFDENDTPVRFMGAMLDITENKLDQIRKNDFIAMASHELKTPLTSLKAYIQLLLIKAEKLDDEFLISSLQKSENQVNRMTALIYGFLDLSKIESGRLELNRQMFNMNELIEEVIADCIPIVPSHTLLFKAAKPIRVNADKEKIGQVLVNFINNAVKYSPKGSTITLSSKLAGKSARIMVKDQGIGINKKHQKNIFERFYRVEEASTRGFSGFGIGLYISAEIIELHHGKIGVESKEDEGSEFYFTLPVN